MANELSETSSVALDRIWNLAQEYLEEYDDGRLAFNLAFLCISGMQWPMKELQMNTWLRSVALYYEEVQDLPQTEVVLETMDVIERLLEMLGPDRYCPYCGSQTIEMGIVVDPAVLMGLCPDCGRRLWSKE